MKQHCLTQALMRHLFLSMTLLCVGIIDAHAGSLSQQRGQFENALEAIRVSDLESFHQLEIGLQDYPLYHYLRYQYLKPRLKQASYSEIRGFLTQYGNTYFGELLRRDWLKQLVLADDWATFVQFYTPQKSVRLQCYYAQARIMTRRDTKAALDDAKKLWLVGKSQPKTCDLAFEYLYQSGLINEALIWKRIGLAMAKGRLKLARNLAQRLDPDETFLVTRWQTMHKKPAQTLADFYEPDSPVVREIIKYGIKRLARKQFELANEYWGTFQRNYAFSVSQIGEMQRDLALISVKHDHPQALKWLSAVNKYYLTPKVSKTRLKLALRKQNWHAVADFITQLPADERTSYKWRYWLARALEQTGKHAQAQRMYQKLANERDYYGFLAADHIKTKYKMRHNPIVFTKAEQAELMRNLSIAGAHEFYQLSRYFDSEQKWILNARREWEYAIKHLSPRQKTVAAALASRWGWHDRAIMTASKAGYYDDLDVRFPLAFYNQLAPAAKSQYLDLAWVYGIVRQESAFMSKVRSRAGALGLMQLMPATGRLVARKIGLKLGKTKDILDVSTNVSLGTAYLRQMLDRFDGNHMLATAAYNAGPGRAKRWANNNACLPSDIWVEMIPFNETRKYVRRVLFYSSVFASRLGKSRPLKVTLAPYASCGFNYSRR